MRLRLLLLIGLCLAGLPVAQADVAAAVVFFSGTPQLTAAGGALRPLARGDSLAAGDTVDTADGRVQLRFRDGATMSLQPGTQFRIDHYRYSGNGGRAATGDGVVMSLIKGALRTVTGLLGKDDRAQYRIGTTVATIGIRGTEFGAAMDASGLAVSTYGGLVEVCSQAGCVDVAPGESVRVRDAAARPERQPAAAGPDVPARQLLPEAPLRPESLPVLPPAGPSPAAPVSPPLPVDAIQSPNTAPGRLMSPAGAPLK